MLRQGIFGCVITKMCNSPLVAMVKNVYSNSKTIKPHSVKGKATGCYGNSMRAIILSK